MGRTWRRQGSRAVVAEEAGLIGASFTTAKYETRTQPIDNVIAMPSGYCADGRAAEP